MKVIKPDVPGSIEEQSVVEVFAAPTRASNSCLVVWELVLSATLQSLSSEL